jgi:hypothetical protein
MELLYFLLLPFTYNTAARSRNLCCGGKAVSITYSECVSVALFNQHAKRVRCIKLSLLACLTLQFFSTLSHEKQALGGKKSY